MINSFNEDIAHLMSYLKIDKQKYPYSSHEGTSELQLEDGVVLRGLITVTKYLVSNHGNPLLLGASRDEQACISQWMEYRRTHLDRCTTDKDVCHMLSVLNAYLADKAYMVAQRLTVADIFLYYTVQRIYNGLTFFDKERLMHLSRWLDNEAASIVVRAFESFDSITALSRILPEMPT